MRLKYIRTQYGFAIFDEGQTHADMAKGMYGTPISAGHCYVEATKPNNAEVTCGGRSVSLKLESMPDDGEFITKKINNDPY